MGACLPCSQSKKASVVGTEREGEGYMRAKYALFTQHIQVVVRTSDFIQGERKPLRSFKTLIYLPFLCHFLQHDLFVGGLCVQFYIIYYVYRFVTVTVRIQNQNCSITTKKFLYITPRTMFFHLRWGYSSINPS